MYRKRDPCNTFLMVKMTSGMDHGRVRLATRNDQLTTTSGNMAAIQMSKCQKNVKCLFILVMHLANTKSCSLGLQHISLILDMHIMFN